MRVNARFDGEYEQQMEFLSEATGLGVSEVLKASVSHYYHVVKNSSPSKLPNLSRYIGKQGSGRVDIAATAKDILSEVIATKHSLKRSARVKPRE
jgi:hypothetical protein